MFGFKILSSYETVGFSHRTFKLSLIAILIYSIVVKQENDKFYVLIYLLLHNVYVMYKCKYSHSLHINLSAFDFYLDYINIPHGQIKLSYKKACFPLSYYTDSDWFVSNVPTVILTILTFFWGKLTYPILLDIEFVLALSAWRVSHMEKELLTLQEHLRSPPVLVEFVLLSL